MKELSGKELEELIEALTIKLWETQEEINKAYKELYRKKEIKENLK